MNSIFVMTVVVMVGLASAIGQTEATAEAEQPDADILIVGAGIAGLTTALEAGRQGMSVIVVDMWSVFGGHGVMSNGKISIVGSQFQEAEGVKDSVELAIKDFHAHGEVADREWMTMYATRSREWVQDWLSAQGVRWDGLEPFVPEGNSVRRLHGVSGRGMGLVSPLFRECMRLPNIAFPWNERAASLVREDGRIAGIEMENLRTGGRSNLRGRAVVLATGGFQNNLDLVRANWPGELREDVRILQGAGVNAIGSGLDLASEMGALVRDLDHQWNYRRGLPHPDDKTGRTGLGIWIPAIAVNSEGKRFMNEQRGPKYSIPIVSRLPGGGYFQVFDKEGRENLFVSGTGWDDDERIQREIFENPDMVAYVKQAETIDELGKKMGIDAVALGATVDRWNHFVDQRKDEDFGATIPPQLDALHRISNPPYFAMKLFPMARKSFGGLAVDTSCRVLDTRGAVIPGLYAVGEVTGFGGVNGRAGLEGTMLGPSVLMGRVAGQELVRDLGVARKPEPRALPEEAELAASDPQELVAARAWLKAMVENPRKGFQHLERAHSVVLSRGYDCRQCHGSTPAVTLNSSTIDHLTLSHRCATCHDAKK